MPEPKTPVIVGLEQHELVIGGPQNGQPQYLPLYALRSPDGRVMSRWELTPEEREMIANGADVFITIHTFNQPYPPTEVMVRNKGSEYLAEHYRNHFGLKDRVEVRPGSNGHVPHKSEG